MSEPLPSCKQCDGLGCDLSGYECETCNGSGTEHRFPIETKDKCEPQQFIMPRFTSRELSASEVQWLNRSLKQIESKLSRLQRENDTLRAEKEKVELGLNHAKDQRDTWRKRFLATAHRATTAESRVAELEKVLQIAPEPYEFMAKSDFNSLPATMRSFVDAHKTWLIKVKSTLSTIKQEEK